MLRRITCVCLLAFVTLAAARLVAEEVRQGQEGAPQSAPAQKPADAGMAGCPHSEGGACCGTCQEKAHAQDPERASGDCPCKHAKQMREGS